MNDKPPPADAIPGAIKDRKPTGVEGDSKLDRASDGRGPHHVPTKVDDKARDKGNG